MLDLKIHRSAFHVGVFDSGRGGEYVGQVITAKLPELKVTTLVDSQNIPYGTKTKLQILEFTKPFLRQFEALSVDVIVIACYSCFTNLESELSQLTSIPILGFSPPLVMATSQTQTGKIVICATQATLKSQSWQTLKVVYARLDILEIDCSHWVNLIETQTITESDLKPVMRQIMQFGGDSLILGCTHYFWIKAKLEALIPSTYNLKIYEPTVQVLQRIQKILNYV